MSAQPEALRLADLIRSRHGNDLNDEAAAELRRLHEKCEALTADTIAEMDRIVEIEWLTRQRDALLEALKEYGWHHEGCPQYPTYTHPDRWPACTCGFDDAIKAVEENT